MAGLTQVILLGDKTACPIIGLLEIEPTQYSSQRLNLQSTDLMLVIGAVVSVSAAAGN